MDEKRKAANEKMRRAKEKAGEKTDALKDDQEFHEFKRDADEVSVKLLVISLLTTERKNLISAMDWS